VLCRRPMVEGYRMFRAEGAGVHPSTRG
jgi:hypothetical protein